MIQIARHVAAAVAALALTGLVAGCSSKDSGDGSTASAATQTSSASTSTGSASTPTASAQTSVADTPSVVAPTAAPLPASDFVEEDWHSFATPTKRIQCRAVDHSFACQTAYTGTVATDDVCGFYPGLEESRAARFGFFGDSPQPCATMVQGDGFHSPHTLDYGQSVAFQIPEGRTVTCSSAVDGLTCTQVGGSGGSFFLSRDSFKVL